MAASDDARTDTAPSGRGPEHAAGPSTGGRGPDRDGGTAGAATSVKANIDRVADKVKHLLGSDR